MLKIPGEAEENMQKARESRRQLLKTVSYGGREKKQDVQDTGAGLIFLLNPLSSLSYHIPP